MSGQHLLLEPDILQKQGHMSYGPDRKRSLGVPEKELEIVTTYDNSSLSLENRLIILCFCGGL